MPTTNQTATALRVLASAYQRDLVISRVSGVAIYAGKLGPIELRWIVEGLETPTVHPLAVISEDGEDREIVGYLLGRVYRVYIQKRRLAELHDVLRAAATTP